jgi:Amidohydrolase
VSMPTPGDVAVRESIGLDRFMWGSDYPHDEGTHPFTREHLRQVFSGLPEGELRPILGGNAAELYGFDLDALAPVAARVGPSVAEVAQPLTELPPHPNEALVRAAAG